MSATVAVIDGPYDAATLSGVLAQPPVDLGNARCAAHANSACHHGTFIVGLLGAHRDALIPGLCPTCRLLHVPLFIDEVVPGASVGALADAITVAVMAGARLINLSLAILGDDNKDHHELGVALDRAEAGGTVVVAAAGNRGRLAMGQLLSHAVTVPVVAVDAACRLLPDSNFGPAISCKGIAALGHEVPGYAPGGGITMMSGTSVATAVATGILAELWSARPNASSTAMRAAVASLSPRHGAVPPMLDRESILVALDNIDFTTVKPALGRSVMGYAQFQGESTMIIGNGHQRLLQGGRGSAAPAAQPVVPAHGSGCSCNAPIGSCTCAGGQLPWQFVYVLGSVDIRFPDQSISEELQTVASKLSIEQGAHEPLRSWYAKVLIKPEARYVARRVCWILKVEGQPAYYLELRDLHDLQDLIGCLGHPEDDLDLLVGSSALVPTETCPGILAPVLAVDQLSSFDQGDLIGWFRMPTRRRATRQNEPPADANPTELFKKLVQSADNFGDTDEWRALNYLAVRYQPLYERFAEMVSPENGWTLDSVKVAPSRLSREKRIVDPIFAFRHKETGVVQKYFVRVDVSHLFPMIVNHLSEYFDR